jgi:molybdopterin converting factor small subunit
MSDAAITPQKIEEYYDIVVRNLKSGSSWNETLRKMPPNAIRAAVKNILERFVMDGTDPKTFDWATEFELLKDFTTVQDFLASLEEQKKVPKDNMQEALNFALQEVEEKATAIGMRIITEQDHAKLVNAEKTIETLQQRAKSLKYQVETLVREQEELKKFRKTTLTEVKPQPPIDNSKTFIAVKILASIPAFVGNDKRIHGPFTPGQVVDIHRVDAEFAVKQGVAQYFVLTQDEQKVAAKNEAVSLWNEYSKAVVANDGDKVDRILEKLRLLRPTVIS